MKRVLSIVLILALTLSLCFSATAFAEGEGDANLAAMQARYPDATVTSGQDINGVGFYKVDMGEAVIYFEASTLQPWGYATNIALFVAAGVPLSAPQNGVPIERVPVGDNETISDEELYEDGVISGAYEEIKGVLYHRYYVDVFTGDLQYYDHHMLLPLSPATKCSVYDQVKNSLVSNVPVTSGTGSGSGTGGGSGTEDTSKTTVTIPDILKEKFPDPAVITLVTDVSGLTNCYAVTQNGSTVYYDYNPNAATDDEKVMKHGLAHNLAVLGSIDDLVYNDAYGFYQDNVDGIDPFTGYYCGYVSSDKSSVYDQIAGQLIPNDPHAASSSGGGTPAGDVVSNNESKTQMINYTAKGTESFLVTVPTQYSSSTDVNGNVTMSGVFKIDVSDLAGDGLQYVNLKLTNSSHKDKYFMDPLVARGKDNRFDAQDDNNSLAEVTDYYLQNEDVATAKIQFAMQKRISETEVSEFNVGDYVICKSVNTMAADYGPFSVTETLEFLLDPYGLTPITDIAHGTYSDLLTFESSVTSSNPQT